MFAKTVVRYTEQSKCKLSCSKRDSRNRLSAHLEVTVNIYWTAEWGTRVHSTSVEAYFLYFCNPTFAISLFLDGVIHF